MSNAQLTATDIGRLLKPFYSDPSAELLVRLKLYLDLLLKWNARTNLTAIRDPEGIVQRHFGESLFTALHIPSQAQTLLDLGSGAGFPGIPIALVHPHLKVTLAESQNKKASFLREAVRTLALPTNVWAARAETLPLGSTFDAITMRAVDDPTAAMALAETLVASSGTIMLLAGSAQGANSTYPVPLSAQSRLFLFAR